MISYHVNQAVRAIEHTSLSPDQERILRERELEVSFGPTAVSSSVGTTYRGDQSVSQPVLTQDGHQKDVGKRALQPKKSSQAKKSRVSNGDHPPVDTSSSPTADWCTKELLETLTPDTFRTHLKNKTFSAVMQAWKKVDREYAPDLCMWGRVFNHECPHGDQCSRVQSHSGTVLLSDEVRIKLFNRLPEPSE